MTVEIYLSSRGWEEREQRRGCCWGWQEKRDSFWAAHKLTDFPPSPQRNRKAPNKPKLTATLLPITQLKLPRIQPNTHKYSFTLMKLWRCFPALKCFILFCKHPWCEPAASRPVGGPTEVGCDVFFLHFFVWSAAPQCISLLGNRGVIQTPKLSFWKFLLLFWTLGVRQVTPGRERCFLIPPSGLSSTCFYCVSNLLDNLTYSTRRKRSTLFVWEPESSWSKHFWMMRCWLPHLHNQTQLTVNAGTCDTVRDICSLSADVLLKNCKHWPQTSLTFTFSVSFSTHLTFVWSLAICFSSTLGCL